MRTAKSTYRRSTRRNVSTVVMISADFGETREAEIEIFEATLNISDRTRAATSLPVLFGKKLSETRAIGA